jgi:Tol biopolymer transport system component
MPREVRIEDLFRLILPGSPALSPQGDRVAFCVKRLDRKENRYTSHLYVMALEGRSRPRQLTRGLVLDAQPAWSANGRDLAFVSDRDGEKTNVWILPLEGGEPRQLTKLSGGPVASLSWSPDGKELLFEHISVPKVDPEERKRQATYKHITELLHKEDGFGFFRGEFWTIWKANAKTGRAVALTAGDHHDRSPRWSPDSKRIVFFSSRRDDRHKWSDQTDIFVMDRNGRGLKKITEGSGSREVPRWSTDGKNVYWVGYDGGPGEWLHHEHSVWKAPASGGKAEILNPGHDRWVANGVISDTNVALMPMMEAYNHGGEERVLFGSDEDGCYRLYSVSAKGGDVRVELGGSSRSLA